MCNALAHAGKNDRWFVSAVIATALPRPTELAAFMDDAEPDVLAYISFPAQHRAKPHSTNPIERLNGEIKRRTESVGIFPAEDPIIRFAGAIPLESNGEWAVQRSQYMTLKTIAAIGDDPVGPGPPNMVARVRRPYRRAPLTNRRLRYAEGHDFHNRHSTYHVKMRQTLITITTALGGQEEQGLQDGSELLLCSIRVVSEHAVLHAIYRD